MFMKTKVDTLLSHDVDENTIGYDVGALPFAALEGSLCCALRARTLVVIFEAKNAAG